MPLHIITRRRLLVVLLVGVAILPAVLLHFFPKNPVSDNLASTVKNIIALPLQEQISFGVPVHLKIPAINVDAFIEPAGVTKLGAMEVPEGPDNVAWFRFGPHPGENGTAVMTGHFGWKNNIPAVFDNLQKLRKGDTFSIEDESGRVIIFMVREFRIYGEKDDASTVFASTDGKAHLNLITCQGVWNKDKKSYSNRLVVFADKME